jgi:hypothetical protein
MFGPEQNLHEWLFGLHKPPVKPHPSYRRLSRYDETGLIWLLEGREVVALTEETADRMAERLDHDLPQKQQAWIRPVGDSLDDFQ